MAEPSPSWWKMSFLKRRKSQPKVLYEIPAETVSNTGGQHGLDTAAVSAVHLEDAVHDPQFDARLEKLMEKTGSKGRHVKVSNSGRFKEKKKVRATLVEDTQVFPKGDPARDENQRAGK